MKGKVLDKSAHKACINFWFSLSFLPLKKFIMIVHTYFDHQFYWWKKEMTCSPLHGITKGIIPLLLL